MTNLYATLISRMSSQGLRLFFAVTLITLCALLFLDISLNIIFFFLLIAFVFQFILAVISLKGKPPIEPVSLTFPNRLHREKLQNELAMAMQVQQGLLDCPIPEINGVVIARRCVPASSVGGDFFGFIEAKKGLQEINDQVGVHRLSHQKNSQLGIVMGDVAGHGLSSALIMALSSGMIDEIGKRHLEPAKVLEHANKDLCRYIAGSEVSHVSAMYALLDRNTLSLELSRAGHTPLYLIRKERPEVIVFQSKGVLLGLFETVSFEQKKIHLQEGDRLVFFTDGLIESRNLKGDLFGEARFKELLLKLKAQPVGHALDRIFDELVLFREGQEQRDDCSVVMIDIV